MYKKLSETKIIYTRYEVSFRFQSTALSIREDLAMVPPQATLISLDDEGEEQIMIFALEQSTN